MTKKNKKKKDEADDGYFLFVDFCFVVFFWNIVVFSACWDERMIGLFF